MNLTSRIQPKEVLFVLMTLKNDPDLQKDLVRKIL